MVATYLIAFETDAHALRFAQRLHLTVQDIATFRDGCYVIVLDASEDGQRERIMQLSRMSSAQLVRAT